MMARTTPSPRPVRLLLAGFLLGCLAVLAAPAIPAHAHATLLRVDPADGAVLSEAPAEVVLTFSEPVQPVPDRVLVISPDGERVERGDPVLAGHDMTIALEPVSTRGTYLVSYRVISADSHPVAGTVTFSVGAPSETPVLVEGGSSGDTAAETVMSVGKYLGYAGLVLLIGGAVGLVAFWPRRLDRTPINRLLWAGVGLVGLGTLITLWVQAPYVTGGDLLSFDAAALRDVLGSTYGTAHIVRLGILAAVAVLLGPLRQGQASRTDLILLGGLAVVGLGTWPIAGHPVASPLPAVSIAVDVVHLAAMSFWLGGLVVLAGFVLRRADERELSAILPRWSRWAALAVTWLALAGVILAVIEVRSVGALFATSYGRLLLVKVGLVAVVLAIAIYSRHLVVRRIAPTRPQVLRLSVLVEAVVLAVVVAVTSVLVQTTPARSAQAEAEGAQAAGDFATVLESPLFRVEVLVEPAAVGSNRVHLYTYHPDTGEPLAIEEWSATATLASAGVERLEISLVVLTDNHAFGEVALPLAGDWEMRISLRISEIHEAAVTTTVPVG